MRAMPMNLAAYITVVAIATIAACVYINRENIGWFIGSFFRGW